MHLRSGSLYANDANASTNNSNSDSHSDDNNSSSNNSSSNSINSISSSLRATCNVRANTWPRESKRGRDANRISVVVSSPAAPHLHAQSPSPPSPLANVSSHLDVDRHSEIGSKSIQDDESVASSKLAEPTSAQGNNLRVILRVAVGVFTALLCIIAVVWVVLAAKVYPAPTGAALPISNGTTTTVTTAMVPIASPTEEPLQSPPSSMVPGHFINLFLFQPNRLYVCFDILSPPGTQRIHHERLDIAIYKRHYRHLTTVYHPDKAVHYGIDRSIASDATLILNFCFRYVEASVNPRSLEALKMLNEDPPTLQNKWWNLEQFKEYWRDKVTDPDEKFEDEDGW